MLLATSTTIYYLFISLICFSLSQEIPNELLSRYTVNGTIPIEYFYVNERVEGISYAFSTSSINKYADSTTKLIKSIEQELSFTNNHTLSAEHIINKYQKHKLLYYTLIKNSSYYAKYLSHNNIAVIGSSTPWIESIALYYNAYHIYTFEYMPLSIIHPQITAIPQSKFHLYYNNTSTTSTHLTTTVTATSTMVDSTRPAGVNMSVIFALRCLDHDGLGRYGDPLDPDADLSMIKSLSNLLAPSGLLFLSVSIGPDLVVYNLLRRYGTIRLTMLLAVASEVGLEVVERVGWIDDKLDTAASFRVTYEPILVFTKRVFRPPDGDSDSNSALHTEL